MAPSKNYTHDPKAFFRTFAIFNDEEADFLAGISEKYPPLMTGLFAASAVDAKHRYSRAFMMLSVTPRKIWDDLGIDHNDAQKCSEHGAECVNIAHSLIEDKELATRVGELLLTHDLTSSMGLEPTPMDDLTPDERYKMDHLMIRFLMEDEKPEDVEKVLTDYDEFARGDTEAAKRARDIKKLETLQELQIVTMRHPHLAEETQPYWELTRGSLETPWAAEMYQDMRHQIDTMPVMEITLTFAQHKPKHMAFGEFAYAFKEALLTTGTSLFGEPRQSGRAKAEQSFAHGGHFHATMHGYYAGKFFKYALAPYSFVAGMFAGDRYTDAAETRRATAENFKATADTQTRQAINKAEKEASFTRPLEIAFRMGGYIAGKYMTFALLGGAATESDETAKTTLPEMQQEKTVFIAQYNTPQKPDPKTTYFLAQGPQ